MVQTEFSKYLFEFAKNTDQIQTHLSFNKGKYNVPDEKFDEFYEKYFQALQQGESLYLIEKINDCNFKFFMDIDSSKDCQPTDVDIQHVISSIKETITDLFENVEFRYIVSKRDNKYHINFPTLVVNCDVAKCIVEKLDINVEIKSCIDMSVYRTGLRMLGSRKKDDKKKQQVYNIYDLERSKYIDTLSFEDFLQTIIRVKENVCVSPMKDKYKMLTSEKSKKTNIKGVTEPLIAEEITKFMEELKLTSTVLENMDLTVSKIQAKRNKLGVFSYYLSINERHCPFKNREHKRESNPIYVEVCSSGVSVRCFDEDCLGRRYPDKGIKLSDEFSSKYPNLYMSMMARYWKTEVEVTEEIRSELEDSLSGSHYQIAKTAFGIYKDQFRVDDIKNTTWYEFDGIRWKKSHTINILISEELPKYYRGIKVSDTSFNNPENLMTDERLDANARNQCVEQIIRKLENVTFKNNILNQLVYLYKTRDPDFYQELDSNPYLIGFKNGIYDFRQNIFRKGQQEDYVTFSTNYDFIEYDETHPQVNEIYKFLQKIIPNKNVREYLLKVLGKALVGIPDEKFYIWTGISGANGKSTLVNFLEHTLGDYTTSVDVAMLTNKRGNSSNASPDVIRLKGKRIFTFQEPEHDDKLRTGILKQFSGGDTVIARELFKAPISFKLQGTMIMCCNDLPSVSSVDGGTWRRIRVIEFKSRFCDNPMKENEYKVDPSIKYKIKEWRPYFMSILIHWYNRVLYEGIHEPDEVKKATSKYKAENDKFNEFFDAFLEESDTFERTKTIYSSFQSWWTNNYPTSKMPEHRDLRKALRIKYGSEKEKLINGTMQYGFNIKIKYETNIDNDSDF